MLSTSVKQGFFIKKIEKYLSGRGRKNFLEESINENKHTGVEGLCNGASLLLLEKIFYDCLDQYYQKTSDLSLDDLLNTALKDFFNDIEDIIETDDVLLDSPEHQQKLGDRKMEEYIEVNRKLDQAIETGQLTISEKDKKSKDYRLTIIQLAEVQNILKLDEVNLLKEVHIPDIPLFERFISQIFHLQAANKEIENIEQHDISGKFSQVITTFPDPDRESLLPVPILEYSESFLITPEELIKGLAETEIFPNERLVWIGLPEHALGAFRLTDQYYFYDSNNDRKEFILCDNPLIFTLKLALSILKSTFAKQKELSEKETLSLFNEYADFLNSLEEDFIQQSRRWLAERPAAQIQMILLADAIAKLEQKDNLNYRSTLLTALRACPLFLGLRWKSYRHPHSPTHVNPTFTKIMPENKEFKEIVFRIDFAKETRLMKLASIGALEALKVFLLQINDPQNGLTPAEKKRLLNMTNHNGNTALNIACLNKNFEIATLLLESGAEPNIPSQKGMYPLIVAINNQDLLLVEALMTHHANVNVRYEKHTPFTCSCLVGMEDNKEKSDAIFAKLLTEADINQLGNDDLPPIFLCTLSNNPWRVLQLLKHGVDANTRLSKHSTSPLGVIFRECSILQYALMNDRLEIVNLLLQYGANPNTKDCYGKSCLALAASNHLAAVKLLLKYGAVPNKKEWQDIFATNSNNLIPLFVHYPCMARGDTKAQQISLLLQNYVGDVNNPNCLQLFPSIRDYATVARNISIELGKDENIDLTDQEIKNIIMKHLKIAGGYEYLKDGEFKKRVDLIFNHLLTEDLILSPQNDSNITLAKIG